MTSTSDLIIDSSEFFPVRLDFHLDVTHNLASRIFSVNVCSMLRSTEGLVGYGECVPRRYVTGETPDTVLNALSSIGENIDGSIFKGPQAVLDYLTTVSCSPEAENNPSAFCAFETSLLDLAGKHWDIPVTGLLGFSGPCEPLRYSMVVPLVKIEQLPYFLGTAKRNGFREVKVKVDGNDPSGRVKRVSEIMGSGIEYRVDANCSWDRTNAASFIDELADIGVVSVEQPLAADDFEGLRDLRGFNSNVLITLDESVKNAKDVERAASMGACDIINVRISKCGGLLGSLRVIEAATAYGLGTQLGSQVGESCILSAAGASLATMTPSFRWLEGCFGRHLLLDDLCSEDICFRRGGMMSQPCGPGLGVTIDPERIVKARNPFAKNGVSDQPA